MRDAGVGALMIGQNVNVARAALDGFYRIAEAKFFAAQEATDGRFHECH